MRMLEIPLRLLQSLLLPHGGNSFRNSAAFRCIPLAVYVRNSIPLKGSLFLSAEEIPVRLTGTLQLCVYLCEENEWQP